MVRPLALALFALLLLPACPSGGSDNCWASYSCSGGTCTCDDGAVCNDPAEADDESASNCLNACEVCETVE